MTLSIIHVNCDISLAKDKSLPRDSYLVTYGNDGDQQYDIVRGLKVEIFNYYWDKYRDVRGIKWTEGTSNPKTWGYQAPEKKRKK